MEFMLEECMQVILGTLFTLQDSGAADVATAEVAAAEIGVVATSRVVHIAVTKLLIIM